MQANRLPGTFVQIAFATANTRPGQLSTMTRALKEYLKPALILLSLCVSQAWGLSQVQGSDNVARADDNTSSVTRVQQFLFEQLVDSGIAPDNIGINVFPPAVSLDSCQQAEPFLPRDDTRLMGRVSVGLRCDTDGNRVRYLQAELHVYGERVIAARDINPGEMIQADMLATERVDLSRLPAQTLTDIDAAIGQQARRPLRQGQSLSEQVLSAPQLVQRGQLVSIEALGQGFRIRRQGEALDNGAQGDTVRVRTQNREIVEAQVAGPGVLTVTF
ncbi:hypothetical protein HCU01_15900 [Halomonas cupida]|uniref:Flagella basal body P-ring formation protein FlgA n=1 Tax=Halomonas cupida TaxID=44933 RepID=A0A1M7G420_9GAMM|nr:flagellar basal body P-ring formation chaperone FlgA [Halomonas cupida]GEN23641.1 hypothetical protein HCU01_15900 [Halomonas cupida]SHM11020.1 flagella basal body P-ring formation protein FlgA [Halomonas cupida]